MFDVIGQPADAADVDVYHVCHGEREVIRRHNTGSCQEDDAVGEAVVAAEPADEVGEGASHLAGVGVAALPDFLIERHIAAGALVPLLTNYAVPEAGMFVVRPPGAFPSRKIRVLIDILVEHFGEAGP